MPLLDQSLVLNQTGHLAYHEGEAERLLDISRNVKRDYGAIGDGATDDTAALQSAITAASSAGGEVFFPSGNYLISDELTVSGSGVTLRGASVAHGAVFGDTLGGARIKLTAGAYNGIGTSGTIKGLTIQSLGFDGASDDSHWVMRFDDVPGGLILRDVSIRQSTLGANGILLDGGTTGIFYARLENVFLASGGGFLGGIALRVGSTSECNANTLSGISILGYDAGLSFHNGGGNAAFGVDLEFCTTGVRFNSSECLVAGGWVEACTLGYDFTAASVACVVMGMRRSGGVTTLYTDTGARNAVRDLDGKTTRLIVEDLNLTKGAGNPAVWLIKGDLALDEGITRYALGDVKVSATAGGVQAVPATVTGYLEIMVDGNLKRVPYFNP